MNFKQQLKKIRDFIIPFADIWQKEVLHTFPYFDMPYQKDWLEELESLSRKEIFEIDARKNYSFIQTPSLKQFLEEMQELKQITAKKPPLVSWLNKSAFQGINPKKAHEIEILAHEINCLRHFHRLSCLVDLGGGRGLLAQTMANYFHFPSLSVDREIDFQERGKKRNLKIRIGSAPLVDFLHLNIGDNWNELKSILTGDVLSLGLHTCGSLANYHLRSSVESGSKVVLNFGCCYYRIYPEMPFLTDEAKRIEFSGPALTMATRAHGRSSLEDFNHKLQVKTYRYAFHILLWEKLRHCKFEALGDSKHSLYYQGFPYYAKLQYKRLSHLSPSSKEIFQDLTEHELNDFYHGPDRQKLIWRMILCGVIRGFFGRLLELYLLLDRALFLEENQYKVTLVSYFDEDLSPRNIGILAEKK